ncbi:uncharacterized protein [Triticum aestivum]|uniref:uncharacterized protein n=1 Tax=Triticum aestivum TaxID=4565 RepID=UPI001D01FB19|nr:uncharacterized protein LOC123158790 [Triticum aestivum]
MPVSPKLRPLAAVRPHTRSRTAGRPSLPSRPSPLEHVRPLPTLPAAAPVAVACRPMASTAPPSLLLPPHARPPGRAPARPPWPPAYSFSPADARWLGCPGPASPYPGRRPARRRPSGCSPARREKSLSLSSLLLLHSSSPLLSTLFAALCPHCPPPLTVEALCFIAPPIHFFFLYDSFAILSHSFVVSVDIYFAGISRCHWLGFSLLAVRSARGGFSFPKGLCPKVLKISTVTRAQLRVPFVPSDIVVFCVVPTTLLVVMLVDLVVMLVLLRLPALFEASQCLLPIFEDKLEFKVVT